MWRRTEKIVKNLRLISLGLFMSSFDFFIDMKNCLIGFVCLIFSFCLGSCCSAKPVATTHTERIETNLHPIPVGADTIKIELCRDTRSECPDGKRSINQRSLSFWRKNSVHSVGSVREKENSVRISSTRGVNISRHETDTTSTLRITLRPDTVFVPYTNHIRSDTIVVPDRICNEKLKQSKFMNIILLIFLTLFVATIIYRKIFHK